MSPHFGHASSDRGCAYSIMPDRCSSVDSTVASSFASSSSSSQPPRHCGHRSTSIPLWVSTWSSAWSLGQCTRRPPLSEVCGSQRSVARSQRAVRAVRGLRSVVQSGHWWTRRWAVYSLACCAQAPACTHLIEPDEMEPANPMIAEPVAAEPQEGEHPTGSSRPARERSSRARRWTC